MRIGIVGDIHGNLAALSSVLSALRHCGVSAILNAGDTVGNSAFPDECVALLEKAQAIGVQGNYDEAVAQQYADCGCGPATLSLARLREASLRWTQTRISDQTRSHLRHLAVLRWLVFENRNLLLTHGQVGDHGGPGLEREQRAWAQRAGETGADIVVLGHSHLPRVEQLGRTTFVNPGSVGKPVDGDPRAACAVVEITPTAVHARILRVQYDIEANARALVAAGLPAEIADQLRRGGPVPAPPLTPAVHYASL
ncbi:MAG: metallophosphoesterase family protein [Candidatus Methylomirabilia bacterium]